MGIDITEEPYDGPVAAALVHALLLDLNERYPVSGLTEEETEAANEEWRAEVTAADVCRPVGCFVVAWLDGDAVGCGALKPFVPYDGGPPPVGVHEIKRMYTAPAARRQGVGRLVLDRLVEVARQLGSTSLCLETGTGQPEALALYQAAGWRRIEPYGHFRDSPFSVCYGLELRGP